MIERTADQVRSKLEWEAATEKLGNLLLPPLPGLPDPTPENLVEFFDRLQEKLDTMRAAYGVPHRGGSKNP